MTVKAPTKDYLILLDIKAIISKWVDLDISDAAAISQIDDLVKKNKE